MLDEAAWREVGVHNPDYRPTDGIAVTARYRPSELPRWSFFRRRCGRLAAATNGTLTSICRTFPT